ncbi:putative ribonuclease H-like domain-containing protein [Tanacetum coccineum]
MKLRESLFPVDIRRPSSGVKLLGGAVSRDAYFISGLAMRRAANAVDLMSLLLHLHDPQNKAVFECLRAPHAQDFLLAIPIDSLGQHMSPVEYYTILKYRLMIPLFFVDAICPVCRKACLDSFGEHAVHCKELPRFKYQHDMVRDVLLTYVGVDGISTKKEALVNFLTDPSDGRSTLRPTDVLVFGWVGGKHVCVDLTRVSPLVGLSIRGFTMGQAALKAASCKVTKHKKACIKNQHVFIPFAFDTFVFLAPEVVELLNRVQWVMHNNVMTPRSTNVIFKHIGFAIQKGIAAQLVARLPSTIKTQVTRDRQKSYANMRRKPLEFEVGDKVMLKVSSWKGVIRFGKRGKLNPRYIGPFRIIAKKCFVDEPLAILLDEIQIDDKLRFIEEPVEIMDQEVKRLKQSRIPIVKSFALRNFDLKDIELESTNSAPTAKLPILKLVPQTTQENGITVTNMSIHATAEEKTNKKNDVKARGLLLMALPNEHQLTSNQYPDAKSMFAAIETRFGESLDSIFNRLQKIVSRLAILGVIIAQEDLNLKFLNSLPPEWNTHVVVWMNKPEVETMSIDDLYNNFKIIEQKVKKTVGTSSGGQNLAFITVPSTSSTNDANTACLQVSAASPSDLEQIHEDDLEAMDLKWQLSLLSVRSMKYYQRTGKKIFINANDIAGYDKSKLNESEFKAATYKRGLATLEDQIITYKKNEVLFSEEVAVLKREVSYKNYEINVFKSELEKVKQEKDGIDFKIKKFDKASKDLDQLLGSQITDKSKKGLGYSAVPPPHPFIFNRPNKLDLSYSGLDEFKALEFKGYGPKDSVQESKVVCEKESDNSKENSDESLVEEQVSQDKSRFVESSPNVDKETIFPVNKKVEFTKPKNHEKPVKKSVRYAEMYRSQSPRGNQRNWNGQKSNQLGKYFVMYNKACYICGSFNHLQINCLNYQRRGIVSRNNYNRVDAKNTHHSVFRNMSPKAVLLKTSLTPLNTVRPVNTAHPKIAVHIPKRSVHTAKRHYYTGMYNAVNTARSYKGLVNDVRVRGVNAVKSSTYWVWRPTKSNGASLTFKRHNYIDAHMAYQGNFKEFNGGYVAFGGGAYGGRITSKGTLKTDNLDFEDKFVPKESLTCLVAKATLDESMLWHIRLGHINFKNINKLVKDNLGRGFPTKRFENNQTCVACLKGKQHRASCKFDGKSDEGFFVGYSLSSKAFRVYNTRTRRVEENLHIRFLENKPMIEGNGTSEEVSQDCIVMSIWKDTSYFDSPTKDVDNSEPKTADDAQKQVKDGPNNENVEQESLKLNAVGPSVNIASPNKEDNTEEEPTVDLGNIINSYIVPTTPNTRIHKDHLIDNVIGDVKSTVQTRRMSKPTSEQGSR